MLKHYERNQIQKAIYYMAFWKRKYYRNRKQISCCQGARDGRNGFIIEKKDEKGFLR